MSTPPLVSSADAWLDLSDELLAGLNDQVAADAHSRWCDDADPAALADLADAVAGDDWYATVLTDGLTRILGDGPWPVWRARPRTGDVTADGLVQVTASRDVAVWFAGGDESLLTAYLAGADAVVALAHPGEAELLCHPDELEPV